MIGKTLVAFVVLSFVSLVVAGDATKPPVPQIERLMKLDEFAKNLPPARVNMAVWLEKGSSPDDPNSVGCLLGLGTAYAVFGQDGLDRVYHPLHLGKTPFYQGEYGIDAGAKFFGISYDEALSLFGGHNRDLTVVRSRIQKILKQERQRLARLESRGICELVSW